MKPSLDRTGLDRITARALVEAGYMPLREYVQMYGDEVTAPDTVPELDDMHARDSAKRPSLMSQFLHLLHHH